MVKLENMKIKKNIQFAKIRYFLVISLLFISSMYPVISWGEEKLLSPDRAVREAVINFVYQNVPWKKSDVEVSTIKIRSSLSQLEGDLRVTLPRGEKLLGRTSLLVQFVDYGNVLKEVWVKAYIKVFENVVLPVRNLKKNHIIAQKDLYLGRMDISRLPLGVLSDPEDVIGMKLKRGITASSFFRDSMLGYPMLVKRGKVVEIYFEVAGLKVTTKGIAKEDGSKNEMVKIENLSSKRVIFGRVIAPGIVKVSY